MRCLSTSPKVENEGDNRNITHTILGRLLSHLIRVARVDRAFPQGGEHLSPIVFTTRAEPLVFWGSPRSNVSIPKDIEQRPDHGDPPTSSPIAPSSKMFTGVPSLGRKAIAVGGVLAFSNGDEKS